MILNIIIIIISEYNNLLNYCLSFCLDYNCYRPKKFLFSTCIAKGKEDGKNVPYNCYQLADKNIIKINYTDFSIR